MELVTGRLKECEFTLPPHLLPRQCFVYAEMCFANHEADPSAQPIVIQDPPWHQRLLKSEG